MDNQETLATMVKTQDEDKKQKTKNNKQKQKQKKKQKKTTQHRKLRRAGWTPPKTGGEATCSRRVSTSCLS